MNRIALFGRALAAAAGVAAMVLGIPLVLTVVVGNPLPDLDALRVGDLG